MLTLSIGITILPTLVGDGGEPSERARIDLGDPAMASNPYRFAGAGLELGGVVGVMAFIGYGIDQWLDSEPWGIVVMSMIGVIGGLYNLIKAVIQDGSK